ncbi:MAG: aminotransferase class V-fold PLP-dependent enzyme [Clostridia bacterium]|nr:aminotransferase class V-fold PLP-dependent enzyme [Clostridia bacterium]
MTEMNSNTPICDFVNEYIKKDAMRLHMPGHKGVAFVGPEKADITEIEGADVLYNMNPCGDENGIIRQSEKIASDLFGSAETLYSTEGSSLCIRAMLFMAKQYAALHEKRSCIVAPRNAHRVFVTAAALLDLDIKWFFPSDGNLISCDIDLQELDKMIADEKPVALYITSPDYLGNIADIKGISTVCKKHGVLLLVDNAHGAYLKFLPKSSHPIDLGADMCCDSAHKTLPALTGSAYLHISSSADEMFIKNATYSMSMFASTSPSYVILQSLDIMNLYISEKIKDDICAAAACVTDLKRRLADAGYTLMGDEPLKLTLKTKPYGYCGNDFAELLAEKNIICEFSDPDFVVMMFSPQTEKSETERLADTLLGIPKLKQIEQSALSFVAPVRELNTKTAVFAPFEIVPIKDAVGRISAAPSVNCPPAVPIVVCGEVIDEAAVKCFEYYGIENCAVVR